MIKKLFLVIFIMPSILLANDYHHYRRARYNKDFMRGIYIGLMISKQEKIPLSYVSIPDMLKQEIDGLMVIPSVPPLPQPLSDDMTIDENTRP